MPHQERISVKVEEPSGGRFRVVLQHNGKRTRIYHDEQGNSVKLEKDSKRLAKRLQKLVEGGARFGDLLHLLGMLGTSEAWQDSRLQDYWQEQYKERMLEGARRRARRKNIPFSIGREDLPIPRVCPVLGIRLEASKTGAGRNDCAPSIDRIHPELGYVPGNVVVISWRANRLKWEGSAAEFRKLAEWLEYVEQLPPPIEPMAQQEREEPQTREPSAVTDQ